MVVPARGEIYWLDFSPALGREMQRIHPALIIQNDVANKVSSLTIVAAITSNLRVADLPVGVLIEPQDSGLPRSSVVHLGHLYTVDKKRLGQLVGKLPAQKMEEINKAILVSLGLREFRI
ncbi:mRNA interferase MazF [Candidatus Hakubella thermalkaliphila]|uniref:mRNA interferase n=1 Tax=Candidatus Hakubella thermalkaliphila TaxID=2754717 RepID=A0A6V8P6Y7_9ACTN|nr:type II toxin-antitoxin system PemK/MazF family toxin [Candidatus Hakubella thermalkaliphila]GFP25905.1 mRNA interferase MazF [Candidatus Hakubella thermalkaliphila]GFP28395.1 mRNA interferase MazF [Candidatus Hakubella thermalkaliphila]GFP35961.1 mRNA interferase MazF [Candidatus Hakubella thermalkaliphila]